MKKSFLALAALATVGLASAQSSVTVFGAVDLNLQHASGSAGSRNQMTTSGLDGSKIGVRGSKDLGGGLAASFHLEADVSPDSGVGGGTNTNNQASGNVNGGGLMFNRRATVSLSGSWGEVRLGRDYGPQIRSLGMFDPFFFQGAGSSLLAIQHVFSPAGIRASNSIGYLYNTQGFGNGQGFYTELKYWLGENASNVAAPVGKNDGTGYGARFGFANGPFDVALALSNTQYATGNVKLNNIGGGWDFGVARALFQYSRNSVAGVDGRGYQIGAIAPVGAGMVRASYSQYKTNAALSPTTDKWQLGYVYNLSESTALYATHSHSSNNAGANFSYFTGLTSFGSSASATEFGVKHSF